MLDGFHRNIDYIRISVTDRCNLRCAYCMPERGVQWLPQENILRYEDILRLCRIFAELGITKFKITGGEPLVRKDIASLIAGIKNIPEAQSITLTTNGAALAVQLPALLDAGLDGINLSLDTLDRKRYAELTHRDMLPEVLEGLEAAMRVPGLNLKVNCVSMAGHESDWLALAALAKAHPLAVRFIELMPIGLGRDLHPCGEDVVKAALEQAYGAPIPYSGVLGNGPAHYYTLPGFAGQIGFISAMSHKFCETCNRVRLTATGYLKTCLQYDTGTNLASLLSGTDDDLRQAIRAAIARKPEAHQFSANHVQNQEQRIMSQIGG